MPVAFGFSTGDFIAGITLIAQIVKSLKKSGGSSQKFRALITTLHTFETILRQIKLIAEERLNSPTGLSAPESIDPTYFTVLKQLVSEARSYVDIVLTKLDKYQSVLGVDPVIHSTWIKHGLKKARIIAAKVKWQLFHDDDIVSWQRELGLRNVLLTSMLLKVMSRDISSVYNQTVSNSSASDARFQHIEAKFDSVEEKLQRQLATADLVTTRSEEGQRLYIDATHDIETQLRQIRQELLDWREDHVKHIQQQREDWCREVELLHQRLKDSQSEAALLIEKLQTINDLQRRLIASEANEHRLIQSVDDLQSSFAFQISKMVPNAAIAAQIITFEDALGNTCHFDIAYVPDSETLHQHLLHRFRGLLGHSSKMIEKRQYVLYDAVTGRQIPLIAGPKPLFKAGQSVIMSICATIMSTRTSNKCPVCGKQSAELSETEITCVYCGSSCRRIEEVDDVESLYDISDTATTEAASLNDIREFRHLSLIERTERIEAHESPNEQPEYGPHIVDLSDLGDMSHKYNVSKYELTDSDRSESGSSSNASRFNEMLAQFNQLQQETMLEDMEMYKAEAFWNPLEGISNRDALS